MDPAKSYFQYESNAHLLVAGEDAADFLQSQFTNDLRPFEAGRCTYGLWLDVKGKVLGDSILLSEGESGSVFCQSGVTRSAFARIWRSISLLTMS